jgi:uncharacterized membrane protein YkvA (DUF1232 family)
VKQLKIEAYTVHLACRDPRVPWPVRLLAICVIGYAFSPIDLIPDFIPVIGYLDDLVLVPLGIVLVIKLMPPGILNEYREQAQEKMRQKKLTSRVAAAVIILIWLIGAGLLGWWGVRAWHRIR